MIRDSVDAKPQCFFRPYLLEYVRDPRFPTIQRQIVLTLSIPETDAFAQSISLQVSAICPSSRVEVVQKGQVK